MGKYYHIKWQSNTIILCEDILCFDFCKQKVFTYFAIYVNLLGDLS